MLHRRDAMIRAGRLTAASLTLPSLLRAETTAPLDFGGRARSCILIYLWGGPPQQDMWDLKPEAPEGIRSQFRPIPSAVPGMDVCEHLPQFARQTDKMAFIRSLTHESNVHEPSVYRTLTGRTDATKIIPRNQRNRTNFPTLGSVVSYVSPKGEMPSAVTIPRPIGHDGITYAGTHAGFLGGRYDPMEVEAAKETREQPTHPIILPSDLAETRLLARQGLLRTLEQTDRILQADKAVASIDSYREQAFSMLTSPRAKAAFSLEKVDPRTRDRYGRNEYGEAILTARRMVEAGVRLVTLSWMYIQKSGNVANVWDNHGPFEGLNGTQMLTAPYCLPPLDQGVSALLEDLSNSGLLDETLVAIWGEFGRTPRLNAAQGRDHWGACQTAVLAGGGIRGGQVYGSSDAHAAWPRTNPVSPEDMLATVYAAMGISPSTEYADPEGRRHRLVDGRPLIELF